MHIKRLEPAKSIIGIIGAGPAGLAATRLFLAAGYQIRVFEATAHVGGTWNYSNTPSETSSLYHSLRCNIPKEAMSYTDEPFPADVPCFPNHLQVRKYLNHFADKYQLRPYIRFNTRVVSAAKHEGMWNIQSYCNRRKHTQHLCHALIVCNGHYSVPNQWSAPDAKLFTDAGGIISHSHLYRKPHKFVGKRVLVIGSGPSGLDISLELSRHASHVYMSHREQRCILASCKLSTVTEVAQVKRFVGMRNIELQDGTIISNIDHVITCTGYSFSFPFLKKGVAGVSVSENGFCVKGLLKQLIAKQDSTLVFPGIPVSIIPFPLFEDQIQFVIALYKGEISASKVLYLRENDPIPEVEDRYYHKLGPKQWDYRRELASLGGRKPVCSSIAEIVYDSSEARKRNPSGYRELEYQITGPGPGEWKVFFHGVDITGTEGALDNPALPTSFRAPS